MPLERERIIWTAIPAGTPSHPRRVSVVVTPRVEGKGRIPLSDLDRLKNWPKYVETLQLTVLLDGSEVPASVVPDCDLKPDDKLWDRMFEPTIDVDLVDLQKTRDAASERHVTLVPPATRGVAVFKQIYRERLAEQAGVQSRMTPLTEAISENAQNLQERQVASWASYLGMLSEVPISTNTDVSVSELGREAVRLMQFHEAFHSRPPLHVFPDPVRDERELGRGIPQPMISSNGSPIRTLPQLSTVQEGWSDTVVAASDLRVVAAPGDRMAGANLGVRLRPGDEATFVRARFEWMVRKVVVQVQTADDDTILYARHLCTEGHSPDGIEFRLPRGASDEFRVTIRSLERQPVVVVDETTLRESIEAESVGKVFRREGGRWIVDAEDREEFHRRVATLRSYPALMRRLGLVIDLELRDPPTGSGTIRVVPKGAPAQDDLCPWTNYQVDGGLFLPQAKNAEEHQAGIRGGFLRNNRGRSRYQLVQLDSDNAILKNLQQARTGAIHKLSEASKVVSLDARGNPDRGGDLPSLRAVGLSLCDMKATEETNEALDRVAEVTRELCTNGSCPELASESRPPSVTLYAEDLIVGYRVDVLRRSENGATGRWRSLCERVGSYYLQDTPIGSKADWTWCDEGYVAQVADEVREPKSDERGLRQSQALFRWDGWSLVAEKPGVAFSETQSGLSHAPGGLNTSASLRVKFQPRQGSLERLRLGERYSFRLRTVDLAGNSLTAEEANVLVSSLDDPRVFNSGCYERVEPLAPPIVIPFEKPGPGEGNDQLVIRSMPLHCETRDWLLLPPGASPDFVELHGELDSLPAADAWKILDEHNDSAPEWNGTTRGHSEEWIRRGWSSLAGKFRVPYLADPLVETVLVLQRGTTGARRAIADLQLGGRRTAERYPDNLPGRKIRVESAKSPRIDGGGRMLSVGLPMGRMAKIEIASKPSDVDFGFFGIFNWCQCEVHGPIPCDEIGSSSDAPPITPEELRRAACAGELGLITPSRELTLVHAVEKPLLPAGRKKLSFVTDRAFRFGNPVRVILGPCDVKQGAAAGCVFDLEGAVWIDRPSTGKLDIRLDWNDHVDDPQYPGLFLQPQALQPFQVSIPLFDEDFMRFREVVAECTDAPMAADPRCGLRGTYPVAGKVRFEDGKHRKTALSFEATSRFADFYPPDPAPASEALPAREHRFGRVSEAVTVHFPARIEPAPPVPVYMVPTFRFAHERRGKEWRAQRRGGLRIFLARNWFSSGEDEKLAVVFAPTRSTALTSPLDQLVSAWAADPLWEPLAADRPPYDRIASGLPVLPERPVLDDVLNAEDAIPSLITPLRVIPADPAQKEPVELPEVELAIAAYTPRFDELKNYWFVDVDIEAPTYFSFLRLGLARYQPFAEEGRALSALVPAAFCQLLPDVSVSVVPTKKRCYEVTVLAQASAADTGVDRLFEVIVIGGRQTTSRLPSVLQDAGPATPLPFVSHGDGEAKWRGIIDADRAGHCPQFLVVERQRWEVSENGSYSKIVGVVPVAD